MKDKAIECIKTEIGINVEGIRSREQAIAWYIETTLKNIVDAFIKNKDDPKQLQYLIDSKVLLGVHDYISNWLKEIKERWHTIHSLELVKGALEQNGKRTTNRDSKRAK